MRIESMNSLALLLLALAVDIDALAKHAEVTRVLPGEKLIVHVLDYHIVEKARENIPAHSRRRP